MLKNPPLFLFSVLTKEKLKLLALGNLLFVSELFSEECPKKDNPTFLNPANIRLH